MSTYDTNKYQFSIHKYRRNYSYLTPPSSQFGGSQFDEKSTTAANMGAGASPRYSLLPHLATEDDGRIQETAPLTGRRGSPSNSTSREFGLRMSTITLLVRIFTLLLIILSIVLLFVFFNNEYITCIVFLFITLAEQLLVICISTTSSSMAFRIRFELKRNDWKRQARMGEQILGHVKAQEGSINGLVIALDALAGVGIMVGAIVLVVCTGSAWAILPFFIMYFQWFIALLGFCNKDTHFKLTIEKPLPHSIIASSPAASVSYYDVEQGSEIGDSAPLPQPLDTDSVH